MKLKTIIFSVILLSFSSCSSLFESQDPYKGTVVYEVSLDSLSVYNEESKDTGFSKYFQTDISYKHGSGETVTNEDVGGGYTWSYSAYVEPPFEAVLEVKHTLRPEYKNANPYLKIPVYTGNLCGLRVKEAGKSDDVARLSYEWVLVSPVVVPVEIYLINAGQWLAEYGIQRYTLTFTEENWEKNKRYK